MRRKCGCSEGMGATYHGLLSPLLLGAGAHDTVGHFAGLLAAVRLTVPSVLHLGVSSGVFVVFILTKCEELYSLYFLGEILQGSGAN